jgi:hypothetical protein
LTHQEGDPLSLLGTDTIAGGSGMMWTTALQIGELVETAEKVRNENALSAD